VFNPMQQAFAQAVQDQQDDNNGHERYRIDVRTHNHGLLKKFRTQP